MLLTRTSWLAEKAVMRTKAPSFSLLEKQLFNYELFQVPDCYAAGETKTVNPCWPSRQQSKTNQAKGER